MITKGTFCKAILPPEGGCYAWERRARGFEAGQVFAPVDVSVNTIVYVVETLSSSSIVKVLLHGRIMNMWTDHLKEIV